MVTLVSPPPFDVVSERCPGCAELERRQEADRKVADANPESGLLRGRRYGLTPFEGG